MANIVSQQSDLFFDFDFESSEENSLSDVNITSHLDDIFLIGCFRDNQKAQLDWILGRKDHDKDNCVCENEFKYNVRLGKGRNGWVNMDNPRIANPQFVVLYQFGDDTVSYCFRADGSSVYSQKQMEESGYPSPQGNYLVYHLVHECRLERFDLSEVLADYRSRTNWVDGKPIFVKGREILSILKRSRRPLRHKKKESDNPSFFGHTDYEEYLKSIRHFQDFDEAALTSIDLFSGCGGLTKGFSMAGIRSIFATDIDENCQKTFNRNFPDVPFLCKDITRIEKDEVDALTGGIIPDIIIGGPPCQGFSLANKRRNKVADDPRNRLFYGFVKFINWYSPKVFVMENVKGLLSMKKGEVLKTILGELTNAGDYGGYNVEYRILMASDYGVPQNRERVIIIGTRKDLDIRPNFPLPVSSDKKVTVDEAISDLPMIEASEGSLMMEYGTKPQNDYQRMMRGEMEYVVNHIAMRHTPRLVERFKAIKPGQSLVDVWETHGAVKRGAPTEKSEVKFSQNNQRLFGDRPAPTIAASFQSNFIHPHLNRNFTAREGARLQSFPDDFIFEGMRTKMSWEKGLSQYQQIGNAVPVLLARAIGKCVSKMITNE